jgi:predicted membrane-bound mannosyltransferase
MAIAEFRQRPTEPSSAEGIDVVLERSERRGLTLEQLAYVLLFILALLFHFYRLGDGALHHDETHHANYSWRLFSGLGFVHDPLLHGPFLYHIGALFFFLFGDSNTTARLGPAIFGSILVVLPYLMRRELGRGAALTAAIYLLLSPAYLYWSRHIRHDMYQVTFEALTFISVIRYTSTRKALWLYIAAAALACMFTNMETFFLYVAMFAPLVLGIFFWRVWKPGIAVVAAMAIVVVLAVFKLPGEPITAQGGQVQRENGNYVCPTDSNLFPPPNPIVSEPGPIFGFEPLATADNSYALCVRVQHDDNFVVYFAKLWQFFSHPSIVLGAVFSIACLVVLLVMIWYRRDKNGKTTWQRATEHEDSLLRTFASLAYDRRWLIALLLFFGIYAALFTSFLVHPTGVVSGTTGSLLYWLAQHGVARGGQPNYYYILLLLLYEPLVALWAAIGFIMAAIILFRWFRNYSKTSKLPVDPDAPINWNVGMPLLLVWWAIGTFALYSWAGEKMPWLIIHVALPLVFLGSWAFARTLAWWKAASQRFYQNAFVITSPSNNDNNRSMGYPVWFGPWASLALYLAVIITIMAFCYITITIFSRPNHDLSGRIPLILGSALLFLGILGGGASVMRDWRWAVGATSIGITLIIGIYTLQSSYRLSYEWPDDARERMIFVQSSTDVDRIMQRLEQASIRRGGELDMPIWYDSETIWAWYLRNYSAKQMQANQIATTAPGPEVQVVLVSYETYISNSQAQENLREFRVQRLPLRWWFPSEGTRLPDDWRTRELPADGKPPTSWPLLMRLLRTPFDGDTQAELWRYLLFRTPPAPLGSTDFVIAVRPELADEIGLGIGDLSNK